MGSIRQPTVLGLTPATEPAGLAAQSRVVLIGTSYKSSPLGLRETLARKLSGDRFLGSLPVDESALLSTCNRFEAYLVTRTPAESYASFFERLKLLTGLDGVETAFYKLEGPDAVRHLFRVAAGLESVVVGEPQILAQVRAAGIESRSKGKAGAVLSPLFDRAYRVGSRVRATYRPESGESSLSDLAIEAVGRLAPGRRDVMLVGTGKMVRLAARRLKGTARRLYVVTKRNEAPAGLEWGILIGYQDMKQIAARCDVLISATSAERPIITPEVLKGRKHRTVVDLGMPRNVSESVRALPNVRLVDLDDLAKKARPTKPSKRLNLADAAASREASEFYDWLVQTRLSSTLADLYSWADSIRGEELARALGRLTPISSREKRIIEAMGRRIVSKLLARPAQFARKKQYRLSEEEKLTLLRSVFEGGRDRGR